MATEVVEDGGKDEGGDGVKDAGKHTWKGKNKYGEHEVGQSTNGNEVCTDRCDYE